MDADPGILGHVIRAFGRPDGYFHVVAVFVGYARDHRPLADFPATVWEFFPCVCADYAVVSEHADIESVPIAVVGDHGLPDWQAAVFVGQWWRHVGQASDDVRVHP